MALDESYATNRCSSVLRLLRQPLDGFCCVDFSTQRWRPIRVRSELSEIRVSVLFGFETNEVSECRHIDYIWRWLVHN